MLLSLSVIPDLIRKSMNTVVAPARAAVSWIPAFAGMT
jgi:hypothetical protein